MLVKNHDFTVKFFTQPFDEVEAISFASSGRKSVFVGNDKTLDIAADNSFQNGVKFSPPKIESRSNFCDHFAPWITFDTPGVNALLILGSISRLAR